MHKNLMRFDLSNRLIHWVRAIDPDQEGLPFRSPEEDIEWGEMIEDGCISPFFQLRRIVRRCQIVATWAFRSRGATIYGPNPAVCFTEMPIRVRKIDTLILAGVSTSGVVLSTVRDAADRDYRLYVLEDGCADRDPEVHMLLMQKVFPRQAFVISTAVLSELLGD